MARRGGYRGFYEQRDLLLLEGARPLSANLSELGPGSHICVIDRVTSHGWDFEFRVTAGSRSRWLFAVEPAARHALCAAAGSPFFHGTARLIGRAVGIVLSWDDGPVHLRATTGEYLAAVDDHVIAVAARRDELPPERGVRWFPFPVRAQPTDDGSPVVVAERRHELPYQKEESKWSRTTQRTSR